MGHLSAIQVIVISSLLMTSVKLVKGQISTPCTTSMISSTVTPCANFITGSTNNDLTPSASCCDSFESLMNTSMDCACLLISANVPIQLPINRALSLILPQACNMNGLPAQCKASASPLPVPGPAIFGSNVQTLPPIAASPLSPQDSRISEAVEAPKYEAMTPAPLKKNHPRKLQEFNQYF